MSIPSPVNTIPLGAKPILFVTETCPVCRSAQEMLKPEIEEGKVEVVEASSEKAKDILREAGLEDPLPSAPRE